MTDERKLEYFKILTNTMAKEIKTKTKLIIIILSKKEKNFKNQDI